MENQVNIRNICLRALVVLPFSLYPTTLVAFHIFCMSIPPLQSTGTTMAHSLPHHATNTVIQPSLVDKVTRYNSKVVIGAVYTNLCLMFY
jgi:hypothetical protein